MDWITHSIRNKLLLVSASGTIFLLAASQFNFWLMLLVGVMSFFLTLRAVTKNVYNPAHQLILDMARLAQGNFTTPVTYVNQGGIGKIAASAELTRTNLSTIILKLNELATEVSSAASSLSATAQQVVSASIQQSESTCLDLGSGRTNGRQHRLCC